MKTGEKTLTLDGVHHKTRSSITEIKWFLEKLTETNGMQRILFLLSFLTYGVGDGITAVRMMKKTGVMHEINPIIRFTYISSGESGVISIKIWFAFFILFPVWLLSQKKNIYWTVNGFLFALFIGGIMAMRANLMAANGMIPPSPTSIIITYLSLTVLFVIIGDHMDRLLTPKKVKQSHTRAYMHPPY